MNRIAVLSVALAMFGFSATAQVQRQGKFGQRDRMEQKDKMGREGIIDFAKDLNLTDAQKTQIKSINEDFKTKMMALRSEKSITVGDMEARKKSLQDEHKAKLMAVLTPEQKAKVEAKRSDMKDRMQQFGEKREEKMKQELNLSNDQGEKLKAINENARKQVQAIKDNASLTQEQKMSKLKEIKANADAQRKAILTPEQQQKFDQMRVDRKENMKDKRMKGGRGKKGKIA